MLKLNTGKVTTPASKNSTGRLYSFMLNANTLHLKKRIPLPLCYNGFCRSELVVRLTLGNKVN